MKFWELFRKKQEEKGGYQEILEKVNMRMMKDERFGVRVELFGEYSQAIKDSKIKKLDATPEEIIQATEEQIYNINDKLHQAAIPYGRSGDKDKSWYTEMVSCWNTFNGKMITYTSVIGSIIKRLDERGGYKPEIQKKQAIQKIRFFFEEIFLDHAYTVGDLSWFEEDVTSAWIGAIQTVQGYGLNPREPSPPPLGRPPEPEKR